MKLTVSQENLKAGLAIVEKAVKVTDLPQTGSVLFKAVKATSGKQALKLRSSNLSLHITTWVECEEVEEVGSVAVPLDLLKAFMDRVPAGESIQIELGDKYKTTFKASKSRKVKSELFGLDNQDFIEEISTTALKSQVNLTAYDLKKALNHTCFAASKDVTHVLSCINLTASAEKAVIAGCDSFRLAEKTIAASDFSTSPTSATNFKCNLPANEVALLAAALPEDATPVTLGISSNGNLATFKFGTTTISTNLFAKDYPNYERIIPTAWGVRAVVGLRELRDSLRAAELYAKTNKNIILVEFLNDGEAQELSLYARSDQKGEFTEILPLKSIEGDTTLSFNSSIKYLAESIRALTEGDKVALEIDADFRRIMLRPLDKEDNVLEGYRFMVLPIYATEAKTEPESKAA
jgi:DNA polymerase III subunit beta